MSMLLRVLGGGFPSNPVVSRSPSSRDVFQLVVNLLYLFLRTISGDLKYKVQIKIHAHLKA